MFKKLKRNTKEKCKELENKLCITNYTNEKLEIENNILSRQKLELQKRLMEHNTVSNP